VKVLADSATVSIHLRLAQRRGTMNIRYRVDLSEAERSELEALLRGGRHAARTLKRAQILLAADAGLPDETIAQSLRVGGSTVYRTRRRFVEGNLDKALTEEPRPGAKRKLTGHEEALLVATACSRPPEGRARWTIELLAGEMVRLTDHGSLSGETVRRRLAENKLKPWREKMWCVPKVDGEYVARMEDVLDLYAEAPDPARPVVCLDESPVQLIGEVREPIPASPGHIGRVDYEYCRNGTLNLFVAVDAHRPWRKVSVTERRTGQDYAERLRELVDVDFPEAECIRVVQDNLSTHTRGLALRDLSGRGGTPHPGAAGVPLHAQARQLAQHGRDRDRRAQGTVPGPAHRQPRRARARDRRLGARTKWRGRARELDVHDRKSPHQDGPRLSQAVRRPPPARQRVIITVARN